MTVNIRENIHFVGSVNVDSREEEPISLKIRVPVRPLGGTFGTAELMAALWFATSALSCAAVAWTAHVGQLFPW